MAKSRVLIREASYESVKEAVDQAFCLFSPDLRGKKVLIKPNVLRDARPEEAITTHPAVLKAVVEKVRSLQPSAIWVGDNPGVMGYGINEACFEKTGLMEAAGGHYVNIGSESKQVPFHLASLESLSVSTAVLEADVMISLPKFKTHGLTVITGAIKNSYGILPGAQKATLHRLAGSPEKFQEIIVDVFLIRPPDFFIVDAVVGMEGNGPASTDLRQIGCIMASDNAVALDATIARMMGLEPSFLRALTYARECGLGNYRVSEIEIIGKLQEIPDFKLPPRAGEASGRDERVRELLKKRVAERPHVNREICTGCGTCVDQCPQGALEMGEDGYPFLTDRERCIACFCCQELCPEKAITLR
ncbi:MAG TPA: DUF362 domain-containing protein [Syntrophales bacterium]|nr:DUF362 domain-containing protein [Syntrophales bacterium]HOL59901.1 DUF362 domain-containing protein [Syntrophales bacterium]HPO36048.1 DUF362 domain-containing protein [Syntrophales bacterium]